jgi:hypothetical protein
MPRVLHLAFCTAGVAQIVFAQSMPLKPASPRIGIYLDFDHVPQSAPMDVMKRAVEGLLRPSGVTLAWRLANENRGTESFSELAVLKFKGRCDTNAPAADDFGTLGEIDTLAFTTVSHGAVMPYTEVECDQVRKALSYVGPGAGTLQRQRALGLALGRVVAHELYHILANSVSHADEGLAKASELLRDLVSPHDLPFDESASRAIQNRFQPERKNVRDSLRPREEP